MQILGKKIEIRTILIILVIILIVLAGYYLITNLPAEKNFFSVEEVLRNKDRYIDSGTIIIRGYYQSAIQSIVSTMSDVTGKSTLTLDYTDVQNASEILRNGIKYDFSGVLQEVNVGPEINKLIFKANDIEVV